MHRSRKGPAWLGLRGIGCAYSIPLRLGRIESRPGDFERSWLCALDQTDFRGLLFFDRVRGGGVAGGMLLLSNGGDVEDLRRGIAKRVFVAKALRTTKPIFLDGYAPVT